jgi:hypothetical protein
MRLAAAPILALLALAGCDDSSAEPTCSEEPRDRAPCGDTYILCTTEGHTDCAYPPTTRSCSCADDGTWHCACACYGGLSNTCDLDCPDRYVPEIEGKACTFVGDDCTYPEHVCHCMGDGSPLGTFVCD